MIKSIKEIAMEIYDFIIPKISNDINFDSISNILENKEFIHKNIIFFSKIFIHINKKDLKIFFTSFLIKYCPNDVFIETKETENKLIEKSIEIISLYLSLLTQKSYNEFIINNFRDELNNYINTFNEWKNNDKKKLLFILSSTYQELILTEQTLKNETNDFTKQWIQEISSQKKSLENYIYKIGGTSAIDHLLDGNFWIEYITPELKESIEIKTKNKIKNQIISELQSNKIPYITIKKLKEIKEKLSFNQTNVDKMEKDLKIELLNMELSNEDILRIVRHTLNYYLDLCPELESLREINIFEVESIVDIMEKINLIIK